MVCYVDEFGRGQEMGADMTPQPARATALANAALIVAAPDLLAALKALVDLYSKASSTSFAEGFAACLDHDGTWDAAKSAIATAETVPTLGDTGRTEPARKDTGSDQTDRTRELLEDCAELLDQYADGDVEGPNAAAKLLSRIRVFLGEAHAVAAQHSFACNYCNGRGYFIDGADQRIRCGNCNP